MTRKRSGDFSDAALNAASAVLAFACAFFAGLMIRDRAHMEQVRLEEARAATLVNRAQKDGPLVDSQITGAIDPAPPKRESASTIQPSQFQVLAVIDGVAFVEVAGQRGTELWPVGVGSELPGAGKVLKIARSDGGRWQVTASHRIISAARQ